MMVVGEVIGSGIFLTPQRVASVLEVPGLMILIWVVTGLLTFAGALTNAEIAASIPKAGGQYVFFRVLYKDWMGFLFGWTTFIVYQTGSIAAIAVAFAKYFGYFFDLPHLDPQLEQWTIPIIGNITPFADIGVKLVAIIAIGVVATINYFGVQFGGLVQNVFTLLKVTAIGAIIILGFSLGPGSTDHFFPLWGMPSSGNILSAMGIAMVATLWSYDGWNSLTFLAGEIKDPQRNLPRALIGGTMIVIVIYVLTNLAYLYVLPIGEIAVSRLVAADMMERVFPGQGGALISLAVMISAFGTVNASSMTSARVYYAMARDKLFFAKFAEVHPRYKTPGVSLIIQAVWASLLTLSGTYDQLFTYVIFAGWIFYALAGAGIFLFRKKYGKEAGAYRVPGYPFVPIVFVLVATWFVINTLINQFTDSMVGLILICAGIPFYLYWRKKSIQQPAGETE